jgi:hypothetical protein
MGSLLATVSDVRLGWKWFPETNTLAYFGGGLLKKKKKGFIALVAKILEAEGFKVRSDLKFINGENNHRYP